MRLQAEFLGRATGALLLMALAVPLAAKAPASKLATPKLPMPDAHQPANPVKDGVDAWSKGDFAAAIHLWQGPAAKGDPDGMYDLGEAYQLGRGVPQDLAKGHLQAADNYGLLLFQRGQHTQAMPYIRAAADRGDPRAQYVLGITYFNGDGVATDWVRAYALENLSEQAGWPPARKALTQMDTYIPLEQRQQAVQMAAELAQQAEANRNRQLAASDFGVTNNGVAPGIPNVSSGSVTSAPTPTMPANTHLAAANDGASPPVPAYSAPSYAAPVYTAPAYSAPAAPARYPTAMGLPPAPRARPRPVTATGSGYAAPAYAPSPYGAAPNPGDDTAVPPPPRPVAKPHARPAPAPAYADGMDAAPIPSAPRTPPASAGGMWKVQLGAFGVAANAEAQWARVKSMPEIAGHPRQLIPTGKVNRLLATGFSADGAQNACRKLIAAGLSCIATRD